MKAHHFTKLSDGNCSQCGYDELAHSDQATCESCGTIGECEFNTTDLKNPKKILMCPVCIQNERETAIRLTEERVKRMKMENIKTPGEFFVSDTPSIKEINDMVNADESIPNNRRAERVCEIIKERIINCQKNILELNQQTRERQKEQNEFQIYLNHKMKEISAEKQKELGLTNIDYKPTKSVSPRKAPTTKKTNLAELKEYANRFNIPIEALRTIVVGRQVSIEQAASIYIKMTNGLDTVNSTTNK